MVRDTVKSDHPVKTSTRGSVARYARLDRRSHPSYSGAPTARFPPVQRRKLPLNGEAERVIGHRKNPKGPGEQFQVLWKGQTEADATWEAASRIRLQIPLLVRAFEEMQQQQRQQHTSQQHDDAMDASEHGVEGARKSDASSGSASDMARMRQQLDEQARLIQQMTDGQQQRAPSHSPRSTSQREPRLGDLANYEGASGARLDDWLAELDQIAQYNGLDQQRTVAYGVVHLKGAARTWWSTLDALGRQAISSYVALAAALRARFQPVTSAATARAELCTLVQGSRGVDAFIADFQRLSAQLPSMAEDDRVYQFARGVRRDIGEKLRLDGVATLAQAITIAARIGNLTEVPARAPASSYGQHPSRLHQMDAMDDVNTELPQSATDARLNRIEGMLLNAMSHHSFGSEGPQGGYQGLGAKSQTKRGYQQQSSSGGRSGPPRRGQPFQRRPPPTIPGVPSDIVQRRWDAHQCVRCGESGHQSIACPNPISSSN